MDNPKNTSYFFIPFIYKRQEDFAPLIDWLDSSQAWELVHDEILYMLKYVADKINSYDKKNCRCFHYTLRNRARLQFGLATDSDWYTASPHKYHDKEEKFRFRILGVDLYCFSTTVCILAYKVQLEKDDPLWVASAQYYLKKASREKIGLDTEYAPRFTFLDLSKKLMEEPGAVSGFTFFYYSNPTTERANVFSYLEVEMKEDYKEELYFLRRCYNEGFLFTENEEADREEIYIPSKDTVWGITSEAAICLACPAYGREDFIRKRFYKNFNAQYLFMYVLLLHQKYVLYMFLMKIGIGTYNELGTLETYRSQLYEFETDFVFSCITEVPQYQNLYERMSQAFALKKMYEDVHEPLLSLSEIRRAVSENEQAKRDQNVNKALCMLSILSFFSALIDSFDFVDSFFSWFFDSVWIKGFQVACIVIVIAIVTNVMFSLVKSHRDEIRRNKDRD